MPTQILILRLSQGGYLQTRSRMSLSSLMSSTMLSLVRLASGPTSPGMPRIKWTAHPGHVSPRLLKDRGLRCLNSIRKQIWSQSNSRYKIMFFRLSSTNYRSLMKKIWTTTSWGGRRITQPTCPLKRNRLMPSNSRNLPPSMCHLYLLPPSHR